MTNPIKGVYLPPELWEIVEEIAKKTGLSRNSVIKAAVLDYAKDLSLLKEKVHEK